MKALELGHTGAAVYWLRRNLNHCEGWNLADTDVFDDALDTAVQEFQVRYGLLADGVVGAATRRKIAELSLSALRSRFAGSDSLLARAKAAADVYKKGYADFNLRADVAEALDRVRADLHAAKAILTSAGGFRDISVKADNAARSVSSFHYTGRALDLAVGSGMEKPSSDPFVVVSDDGLGGAGNRLHRVYARAANGTAMTLQAVTYAKPSKPVTVTGKFVDLTEIMRLHGFERIAAKRRFYDDALQVSDRYLFAEWWHFQYQLGLVHGYSTFGTELSLVWPLALLENSDPWKLCGHYVFGESWN